MENTSSRISYLVPVFFIGLVLLMGAVAYTQASSFEIVQMSSRLLAALVYFIVALIWARLYVLLKCPCTNRIVMGAGMASIITASVIYSWVRQEWVIAVWPAFFSLPGVILGTTTLSRSLPVKLHSDTLTSSAAIKGD